VPFPEIRFPSPGWPTIVFGAPTIRTPSSRLGILAVPAAFVPILFRSSAFPFAVAPLIVIPTWFPEITFWDTTFR
jgi:hypothetical protein